MTVNSDFFSSQRAPRVEGFRYPGAWPEHSFLMPGSSGTNIFPYSRALGRADSNTEFVARLGNTTFETEPGTSTFLDIILAEKGLPIVKDRFPVLAVGSNASPAQIRHKFAQKHVTAMFPSFLADVENIAIGFQPSISFYGAFAATPFHLSGVTSRLFIQLLDAEQLQVMDQTEMGYKRVWVSAEAQASSQDDSGVIRATFETGEKLLGFYVYVSEQGYLELGGQAPIISETYFPADTAVASEPDIARRPLTVLAGGEFDAAHLRTLCAERAVLPVSSQDALLNTLQERNVLDEATCALLRSLQSAEGGVEAMTSPIDLTKYSAQSPNSDFLSAAEDQKFTYPKDRQYGVLITPESGRIAARISDAEQSVFTQAPRISDVVVVARSSSDDLDRRGESVISFGNSALSDSIPPGSLVEIWSPLAGYEAALHRVRAPSAVARVVVSPIGAKLALASAEKSFVEVDELLRIAIGLKVGEQLAIRSLKHRNLGASVRRIIDVIFGKPPYVLMRVTKADVTTIERDYVLIPDLALKMLGVQSGDPVIIEAADPEEGVLRALKLPTIALSNDTWDQRQNDLLGTWSSQYPSARDTLGAHNDIPPMMLDAANRTLLGLKEQPLAVVRVRATRPWQYIKAWREIPIALLALAVSAGMFYKDQEWVAPGGPQLVLFIVLIVAFLSIGFFPTRLRLGAKARRKR